MDEWDINLSENEDEDDSGLAQVIFIAITRQEEYLSFMTGSGLWWV